jgi:hypothetical protein
MNASDYKKAKDSNQNAQAHQNYMNWGCKIANEIDPLFDQD